MSQRDSPREHRIRLAGGWRSDRPEDQGQYLVLPIAWTKLAAATAEFTLSRSFQAPSIDPSAESVVLESADTPGVVSLRLNRRRLPEPPSAESRFRTPLAAFLQPKNLLEVRVNPIEIPKAFSEYEIGDETGLWGRFALVIVSAERDENR